MPWSVPPTFAFYALAELLWFGLKFTLGDDSPPFDRRNVLSLSELPARVNKSKERLLKPGRIDAEPSGVRGHLDREKENTPWLKTTLAQSTRCLYLPEVWRGPEGPSASILLSLSSLDSKDTL